MNILNIAIQVFAFLSTFSSAWLLGKKNKWGLWLAIFCDISWIYVGITSNMLVVTATNTVLLLIYIKSLIYWRKQ